MTRTSATLLLAASASLAACGHLKGEPPALPKAVPAAYAEAPAEAAGEPDVGAWWSSFGDSVLDHLVKRALGGNLDLQIAAQRIVEARQGETAAGARRLPQLQADTSASRNRISENAIPIPPGAGAGGPGGGAPSPFGLPGSEFNSFRLGVDASWELDLFGGAASGVKAARARTRSAEWSRRDLEAALAAEVAGHYLALRSAQAREAIAWSELSRQRQLLSIVQARADAGYVGGQDVAQQQGQVAAAEARSYPLEGRVRAEMHALAVLAGQPPEALIDALTKPAALPAAPAPPAGLPSDLLRRRPDIRRAESDVAAAAGDVGVATADLYPKITLSAQPGFVSTELASLLDWGSRNYTLSAGLLWPIFEGGRLKARLAQANARQAEALIAYRKAVLVGLQEAEDALARYQADDAARGSTAESLAQARAAEALATDRYRAGETNYAGVLATEQAVTAGEDQLAQADLARTIDVVALYKALGGGWREADLQETRP